MAWYLYLAVIGAGFIAGFINTLAGSGSLVTLPLLIFLGLPANVANGTNRVGVVPQNVVGLSSFGQHKVLNLKHGLLLSLPAVVGAVIGAQIAVNLNEEAMRRTIGVLMVAMLVVIFVQPKRWLQGRPEHVQDKLNWKEMLIYFAIGIYGGFIQAGVGIFLLAGLVLASNYDLVRANAIKLLIVLCFTIFALGVFVLNDQVRWGIGFILAIGNMLGAWVAARMAVNRGAEFVRWLLIAVIIISAAKLLGVFELIASIVR